ncbi:MAG TPA: molybdopterin cofactor-binding domain-containing protein [Dehalococcoidales bacterium]|nr:molybdopterin cofactor-binding domain-containing protein [Dehalococcoidales bacterium]
MAEEQSRPWLWKAPEGGVLGKHVKVKDGYAKASGRGLYTRDIYRPGMLYAKIVRSPHTRAKIKKIDTAQARALPGVWDVITYHDPDFNIKWFRYKFFNAMVVGESDAEMKLTKATVDANGPVADAYTRIDEANWNGQPVGIVVVAESEEKCDEGLKLIKIDWEEQPWIMDIREALKPDAPVLYPEMTPDNNLRRETVLHLGDIEKGFQEADQITEWEAYRDEMSWAGTEAMVGIAEWKGDELEAWFHGQDPRQSGQQAIETLSKIAKLTIHTPLQGAIFGGLSWMGAPETMIMIAAIASRRTGRPVKVLYDHSHFHGFEEALGIYKFKVGFTKKGKITAVQLHYIGTCLIGNAIGKLHQASNITNIKCTHSVPHINRGPVGPQRAGAMECIVVTEVYEHVAGELGIDPTSIAGINDGCYGYDMEWVDENVKKVQGFDPTRDSLKEVMEAGKKAIDWDNKWHLPGTKRLPNGKFHGIGCMWAEAWTKSSNSNEKVGVTMLRDGSVNIVARGCEAGTHRPSTYTQIVASVLGVRYEHVNWKNQDDPGFDVAGLGSSTGLLRNAPPLIKASQKLKKIILDCAVKPRTGFMGPALAPMFPENKSDDLDIQDSEIFEKANPSNRKPVSAVAAFFSTELFAWDSSTINGEEKYNMGRQAYFVEVEVDPDTGEVDIKNIVVSRDCGKVFNPDSCDQQLYGVYQGMGRSITEAIYRDPVTGKQLNDNLIDYPQLTMNDIENIKIIKIETGLGYGPYGMLGIGESSACCAQALSGPAIFNAIGKYVDSFPTTPDKILKALGKA